MHRDGPGASGRISDAPRRPLRRGRAVKRECTVLISSAGRRVELIHCFRDGAAALGIELTVIAADLDPTMSAACQVADLALAMPRCDRPEFTDALLGICLQDQVDLIVPTIDPELEPLSRRPHVFARRDASGGVRARGGALARDKLRTAAVPGGHGISRRRAAACPRRSCRHPTRGHGR